MLVNSEGNLNNPVDEGGGMGEGKTYKNLLIHCIWKWMSQPEGKLLYVVCTLLLYSVILHLGTCALKSSLADLIARI